MTPATRRAVLASTAAALVAPRAATARAEAVVRVEGSDEVLSWDPHAAWHLPSIIAVKHVYETLVHVGPDLAPEPALATSWRLAEPTAWELELRQGVRFQDGTPLTDFLNRTAESRWELTHLPFHGWRGTFGAVLGCAACESSTS